MNPSIIPKYDIIVQMNKPYFLWDYVWNEKKVRKVLKDRDENRKAWLIGRILESAKFDDVFKYLTIKEILDVFPKLKLKNSIREAWERAFKVWGY